MLKNKHGHNPFSLVESLPDEMRPQDEVINHAKLFYSVINQPDLVTAWNNQVIFTWYFKKNKVTYFNEMIFSKGNIIEWKWN